MFTPLRILILEDSLTDTELMLYELRRTWLEIHWQRVETEPDFLACLGVNWDVILADFYMPQFEAMRALRILQARGLDIPLIIVTGSITEEVAVECIKQGVTDYLLKDRLTRLGQAVMQAVQKKKLRDEKRQAEAALQESEERFRRLAENAQDIIYRYRFTFPQGFEYISPAVKTISGYTPEEYYAEPYLGFRNVYGGDRQVLQRWIAGEGLAQPTVLRWFRKDGTIIWTEHSNVPIYNATGDLIAIEGIARDITERKKAEFQLQQQLLRDRLLATIASRIRRSLNLDEILHTTVVEVRQFLQADRVIIYRLNEDLSCQRLAESTDPNWPLDPIKEVYVTLPLDIVAEYQHRHVQAINDINQTGLSANLVNLMTCFQIKARLVVPILQDNLQWGLLAVHQCSKPRQWQLTEINLLERLATQVAIAIQQAQLFNQVQQQANREQLLNYISRVLNSSLDPEHILQEIVNLIGESFGVDRVNIFSIDMAVGQIRILNEWRNNDSVVSLLNWHIPISEHLDLLNPNSHLSLYRVFHAPNCAKFHASQGKEGTSPQAPQTQHSAIQCLQILSALRVPIFIRDQLFGGISLHLTTTYRTFAEEEIHLLERIADGAAIALYNAQSYERLEQLVKERTQELEEEKLISEAANRAKSEFLTNMSHELRTPLTAILGFSNLLQELIFGPLNEKQQQYINAISSSGSHLLNLINDLLDLSKIEAGKEELSLETIQVHELCQACLYLIRERANKRGLQLSLDIAAVTTCIADKRRLQQILFNLLSNAVKFTEAGSVTLKVEQIDRTIKFSVIDTGIGISQADQATLFQPFQQVDSGLNRKYEGTGLGLALSRRLAQLHGGDITLTSELGCGSCFTLHLPQPPIPRNIS